MPSVLFAYSPCSTMRSCRQLTAAEQQLRTGRWTRWELDANLGMDVHDANLGLLGFGAIGQAGQPPPRIQSQAGDPLPKARPQQGGAPTVVARARTGNVVCRLESLSGSWSAPGRLTRRRPA